MSVDIRVDQIMFEERGAARVFLTEEQQPPEIASTASIPPPRGGTAATHAQEQRVGTGQGVQPLAAAAVDHGPFSAGIYKEALPEMLRLKDYLDR